jgi:hypothetical protein
MTYSSDRLDRIEAILEANAQQLVETRQIADSNARAIEAWGSRIEEGIAEAEEVSSSMAANTNRRMEEAIADTVGMIANLGRQQQETDQRFEVFLAEARADRAEMRAAREANSTEHRAFTQNIQVLLAEIARLWQRVAG